MEDTIKRVCDVLIVWSAFVLIAWVAGRSFVAGALWIWKKARLLRDRTP
jgi:hypothetical protein